MYPVLTHAAFIAPRTHPCEIHLIKRLCKTAPSFEQRYTLEDTAQYWIYEAKAKLYARDKIPPGLSRWIRPRNATSCASAKCKRQTERRRNNVVVSREKICRCRRTSCFMCIPKCANMHAFNILVNMCSVYTTLSLSPLLLSIVVNSQLSRRYRVVPISRRNRTFLRKNINAISFFMLLQVRARENCRSVCSNARVEFDSRFASVDRSTDSTVRFADGGRPLTDYTYP